MIGVVVPVHNEEDCLEACLMALRVAAMHPGLNQEPVVMVVVLDDCSDNSTVIAARHATGPMTCLTIAARNVGMARHAGAEHLLARNARWLAFTDADSRVASLCICSADDAADPLRVVCCAFDCPPVERTGGRRRSAGPEEE